MQPALRGKGRFTVREGGDRGGGGAVYSEGGRRQRWGRQFTVREGGDRGGGAV